MSTREKILVAIVIIFFVCVVVWVVRSTPKEPPPIEKFDPPTVMEYEGNTITEEKDGKIIWELTCDKLRVDSITQDMELIGVKGKFYEEDKTWNLTAAKGIYDQTGKIIYVEGDVVITNSDGAELLSDELIWLSEKEILTAIGNVKVTNDDGAKLHSDKLEWFTAEEKLIATGNVKISKEDMRGFGDLAYAESNFKKFGLLGHAKVLKGVKDDDETMKF